MKAIQTTELTKRFSEFAAVDSLNLSIEEGELFSLLGVNGAGKTTTLKMLSCLIKPTCGDAILLGDSIVTDPFAVKKKDQHLSTGNCRCAQSNCEGKSRTHCQNLWERQEDLCAESR